MPALFTHDAFGRDVYGSLFDLIGGQRREFDAFLLGNQGPDVLFFAAMDPTLQKVSKLGQRMHRSDAASLIAAFKSCSESLSEVAKPIARAYVMGFICHYILDSSVHPFIYAQQKEVTSAGVAGLGEEDGHEVHATIERELDELVITEKFDATIAEYRELNGVLRADKETTRVISCLYHMVAKDLYNESIALNAFERSVALYRTYMKVISSPKGIKRRALGAIERVFRNHSFIEASSHMNSKRTYSAFANSEHDVWKEPLTGRPSCNGFWDIYNASIIKSKSIMSAYDMLSIDGFRKLSKGIDFLGNSTEATILDIKTIS